MNILLVTVQFPPKNVIGSLRLYSFAYYWHKAGHNISVLTTKKNKKNNDLELDCSFINIIESPLPFLSRMESSYLNISKNNKINLKNIIVKIFSPMKELYMLISDNLQRVPSFYDLWSKKALKLVKAGDFDVILSSGGPYSVHRVGLSLKKKNKNIKWIVDWRDLWTPTYNGKGLFSSYEINLEKSFHNNADLITCVTEPNTKIISMMTSTSVKTIYNGFFPYKLTKTNRNNSKFSIVYIGSFYRKIQDISPLFEAISRIKRKNIEIYKNLEILFAGKNSNITDIVQKYDISECYKFLGFVKMESSLDLQYNSNAVLFVDYNSHIDGVLSGKILEYIYYSNCIIGIGNDYSSSGAELIKESNTGVYLGNDVNLIEQYLTESITNPERYKYNKNNEIINQYTRENQANILLNLILNLK